MQELKCDLMKEEEDVPKFTPEEIEARVTEEVHAAVNEHNRDTEMTLLIHRVTSGLVSSGLSPTTPNLPTALLMLAETVALEQRIRNEMGGD